MYLKLMVTYRVTFFCSEEKSLSLVRALSLGKLFLVGKLLQRVSKAKDAKACRIYRDGEEEDWSYGIVRKVTVTETVVSTLTEWALADPPTTRSTKFRTFIGLSNASGMHCNPWFSHRTKIKWEKKFEKNTYKRYLFVTK